MKKSLMLIMFIASFGAIIAQTEKGKFVASGGTGLQFISSNLKYVYDGATQGKGTVNSFSIIPSVGYFVIDNLAVGLAGNFTSSSTKEDDNDNKYVTTSLLILPTALYYVPLDGQIKPIIQVGAGLTTMSEKDGDDKSSGSGLAINFGGGIASFIKDNISLNLGLSYTIATLKDNDNEKSKLKQGNFGANMGFSIYF